MANKLINKVVQGRVGEELQHLSGRFFAGSLLQLLFGIVFELLLIWAFLMLIFGQVSETNRQLQMALFGAVLLTGSAISTVFAPKGRVFQRSSSLTGVFLVTLLAVRWYFSIEIPITWFISAFFLMYFGYRCGWFLRTRNR